MSSATQTPLTPFEQARRRFQDGIAHFEAGRHAEAERCFEASLALLPARASTLVNLGATRLKLGRPADALRALDEAVAADPHDVDARLHRASALSALSRRDEALAEVDRVLAAHPDHPTALHRRGVLLSALRRHGDALEMFERLTRLTPERAESWSRRAKVLQRLQRPDEALACAEHASTLEPRDAALYTLRGSLLKDLGRAGEAAAAFREAIALGGDAELNGFYLAALAGEGLPPASPRRYVESLFDDYATTFEQHVRHLGYRAPEILLDRVRRVAGPGRLPSALDLGCGTGLCGPLLRGVADRVDGVDLSAAMLDQARATGCYDRLAHADLADHLRGTERRYALVVAADTFIYVGALDAVFDGVARVLEAAGLFAFTVEEASAGRDLELRPSLRYAHGEPLIRALAGRFGFELCELRRAPIREEQRRPIDGLYAVLRRVAG